MTMTKRKESTSSRGPVKGDSSRRPEQDYPNVADWNHNYDYPPELADNKEI